MKACWPLLAIALALLPGLAVGQTAITQAQIDAALKALRAKLYPPAKEKLTIDPEKRPVIRKAAVVATPAPAPAQPGAAGDEVNLLYLGDSRPYLFRLHIQVDGKPYHVAWNDFIYSLFQFLDRDGDLVLSKTEAERAPNAVTLQQQLRAGYFYFLQGNFAAMGELDVNQDGKVTPDELAGYYRRGGSGAILWTNNNVNYNNPYGGDAITEAIFAQLDKNKDGKLAKEELMLAGERLRVLDQDDDEILTALELMPNPYGYAYQPQPRGGGVAAVPTSPFLSFGKNEFTPRLLQQFFDQYDKDKNGKLSRAEIAFEKETFDALDLLKDEALTKDELAEFLGRPPDFELRFRLGASSAGEALTEVLNAKPSAPQAKVAGKNVTVNLTGAQIALMMQAGPQQVNTFNYKQYYQQQFKLADADKNGYLDMKEVQQPQFRYWQGMFAFADHDNDGKLYEKELLAVYTVMEKVAAASVQLSFFDSGRGLFDLLDGNRDGRLAHRELRAVWSQLAALDQNQDSHIAKLELPRQLLLTLSQGMPNYGRAPPAAAANQVGRPVAINQGTMAGPLWFRKMDRNSDGDVSPREFLGPKEDFRKIDADADGLISLTEAENVVKGQRQDSTAEARSKK